MNTHRHLYILSIMMMTVLIYVSLHSTLSGDKSAISLWLITLGALLINSFILLSARYLYREITREVKVNYPKLPVVLILLKKHHRRTLISSFVLVAAAAIYIMSGRLLNFPVNSSIVIAILSLMTISHLSDALLDFRIRNGFYGKNNYEAREIVAFLIEQSTSIDFTDYGKPKKILSDSEFSSIVSSLQAVGAEANE